MNTNDAKRFYGLPGGYLAYRSADGDVFITSNPEDEPKKGLEVQPAGSAQIESVLGVEADDFGLRNFQDYWTARTHYTDLINKAFVDLFMNGYLQPKIYIKVQGLILDTVYFLTDEPSILSVTANQMTAIRELSRLRGYTNLVFNGTTVDFSRLENGKSVLKIQIRMPEGEVGTISIFDDRIELDTNYSETIDNTIVQTVKQNFQSENVSDDVSNFIFTIQDMFGWLLLPYITYQA